MATITYTLTHPHCRSLKTYTQQLRDRSETASDSTQWTAIKAAWSIAATAAATPTRFQVSDLPQDINGHVGRHLHWILVDAVNRSHENTDIKADIAAIWAEIDAFAAP